MLRRSPFQQAFGFRSRDEHTGTNGNGHRAESGGTDYVLQRNSMRTSGDKSGVAIAEVVVDLTEYRQSPPTRARGVRGQFLGVGPR